MRFFSSYILLGFAAVHAGEPQWLSFAEVDALAKAAQTMEYPVSQEAIHSLIGEKRRVESLPCVVVGDPKDSYFAYTLTDPKGKQGWFLLQVFWRGGSGHKVFTRAPTSEFVQDIAIIYYLPRGFPGISESRSSFTMRLSRPPPVSKEKKNQVPNQTSEPTAPSGRGSP